MWEDANRGLNRLFYGVKGFDEKCARLDKK